MKSWIQALIVFLTTSVVSFGCFAGAGFLLDDYGLLCMYRTVGPFGFNYRIVGQSFFRPVTMSGTGLVWKFFGANPDAFLWARIILLALIGFCIWGIWPYLFTGVRGRVALLAPLLFILWPNHGEVMGWLGGLPDLLAALPALASLWCWLSFQRSPTIAKALFGTLLILVAFGAKESCLPILIAIPAFGWLAYLCEEGHQGSWFSTKSAWMMSCLPLIAFLAFMAYRTNLLGVFIGGYGHKSLFTGGLYHLLSSRGTIETANMYFPLARLTARLGAEWSSVLFVATLIWGGALGLAITWPRSKLGGRFLRILPAVCLAISLVWIFVLLLDEPISLLREALNIFYQVLMLATHFAIVWGVHRWMTDARLDWLIQHRTSLLLAQVVMGGLIYRQMNSALDLLALSVLMLSAFWSSRPLDTEERDPQTHLFVVVCIILSIVAIFIVLNLPVGWDGQQERFSFFGSIFSTMAIAAVVQAIPRPRQGFACMSLLIICFVCLEYSNIKWFRVGRIAAKMSEVVQSAHPGTNVFVLAAPGVLDGAGLYQIGLDQMPFALKGDSSIKVGVAYTVDTFNMGDAYIIKKLGQDEFQIQLKSAPSNLHNSVLHARSDPMFQGKVGSVRLVGRKPGDMIYVISQEGPTRLE